MTGQSEGGWASPAWGEPAGLPSNSFAGDPGRSGYADGSGQAAPGYPPPDSAHSGFGQPGQPPPGYGPYSWPSDPTPKPGVVPLRPLGVGEVLDGAITTIRRHPKITIGLAAVVVTVQQVISAVAQYSTGSLAGAFGPDATLGSATTPLAALSSMPALILAAVNLVLGLVLGALLTGALMVVVGQSVLGRPAGLADVWQQVKPRFWALLVASVLAGLAPFFGIPIAVVAGLGVGLAANTAAGVAVGIIVGLLLLIPGSYVWAVLSLTTPAITLEKIGPIRGLRRSIQLVRRDFWRVWGIQVLAFLIAQFLAGFLTAPFSILGVIVLLSGGIEGEPSGSRLLIYLILISIGVILAGSVTGPFLSGVTGLMYIDRRMRGEGFDISLQETARTAKAQQSAAGGATAGWP